MRIYSPLYVSRLCTIFFFHSTSKVKRIQCGAFSTSKRLKSHSFHFQCTRRHAIIKQFFFSERFLRRVCSALIACQCARDRTSVYVTHIIAESDDLALLFVAANILLNAQCLGFQLLLFRWCNLSFAFSCYSVLFVFFSLSFSLYFFIGAIKTNFMSNK